MDHIYITLILEYISHSCIITSFSIKLKFSMNIFCFLYCRSDSISIFFFLSLHQVLRSWRQKYEVLLGLVREPVRLLPDHLTGEVDMLKAKRQGFAIERALVQANIDAWETTPSAKVSSRRTKER